MRRIATPACALLATATLLLLLPGCGGGESGGAGQPGATITLKAADVHPTNYPTVQGLQFMADRVKEKSGGRIQIKIYASGVLGDEKSAIEQTQQGAIDINRVSCSPLAEFCPKIAVYSLPYLFRDNDHAWRVLGGEIGQELLDELRAAKLVGLCYYDAGARSFYNREHPIKTVDDLNGLKIRVQPNKVMIDVVQAMGASPTPMSFSEVYSALQTGVIDGAENNPPSYYETRHFEVAGYYTLDEHTRVPEVIAVSLRRWDSLSEEDRGILREAAVASVDFQREKWAEYVEEALAKVAEGGAEVAQPEDMAGFREAAKAVYDQYPNLSDLIKRIQAAK